MLQHFGGLYDWMQSTTEPPAPSSCRTLSELGGADKYANKVSMFKKEYPESGRSPSLPGAALGEIWGMKNSIGPKRSNGFEYFKLSERDKAIRATHRAPAGFNPSSNSRQRYNKKKKLRHTSVSQLKHQEGSDCPAH